MRYKALKSAELLWALFALVVDQGVLAAVRQEMSSWWSRWPLCARSVLVVLAVGGLMGLDGGLEIGLARGLESDLGGGLESGLEGGLDSGLEVSLDGGADGTADGARPLGFGPLWVRALCWALCWTLSRDLCWAG